jgi:hypothetical protein
MSDSDEQEIVVVDEVDLDVHDTEIRIANSWTQPGDGHSWPY